MPPTMISNLTGRIVGNYRLTSLLGKGGMSTVFLGQPLNDFQSPVALKVLLSSAFSTPEEYRFSQARFAREIQTIVRLHHDHIVPVIGYGEVDGQPYMLMPYLSGGTLTARLNTQGQPLPLPEIATIATQIADALDYAHQQGIIHRDIKSSNILLDEQGKAYLADFGIAHLFDTAFNTSSQLPTRLTMQDEIVGTPAYMAPERFTGEQVGPAVDIYAFGILLYQMVTGRVPFQGDSYLAIAMKHLNDVPQLPHLLRPDLPEPAEAAIMRTLAKDPHARFASAGEFARAFEAGLKGEWKAGLVPLFGADAQSPSAKTVPEQSPPLAPGKPVPARPMPQSVQSSRLARLFRRAKAPLAGSLVLGVLSLALLLNGWQGGKATYPSQPAPSNRPGTITTVQPTHSSTAPGQTPRATPVPKTIPTSTQGDQSQATPSPTQRDQLQATPSPTQEKKPVVTPPPTQEVKPAPASPPTPVVKPVVTPPPTEEIKPTPYPPPKAAPTPEPDKNE